MSCDSTLLDASEKSVISLQGFVWLVQLAEQHVEKAISLMSPNSAVGAPGCEMLYPIK
jgi:hypothetical protein